MESRIHIRIRICKCRCCCVAHTPRRPSPLGAVARSVADMFAQRIRTRVHLIRFAVKLFGVTFIAQAAGKVIQIVQHGLTLNDSRMQLTTDI